MGRHLLAPGISPEKRSEGAFAGLIGSIIAGVAIGRLDRRREVGPSAGRPPLDRHVPVNWEIWRNRRSKEAPV